MKKKTDLIKFIRSWGIIFLLGLGAIFIFIDVANSYRDFNLQVEQTRSDYIDRQKQTIRQEVMRVVNTIRYQKSQSEKITKEKIQTRVYEAYSIVQNIYRQYRNTESKAKIQQLVRDALRPIRFENGIGYYFATRFDGTEMLFADRPQMEGRNLLAMQDTRGQYVIKDMIEIAKTYGEGFYEYHWTKPGAKGNDFKKISFIKRFEPWDWFIGTGLYVDDIEDQIKNELLSSISRIRFGKEGYIFVNRLNGDALVSNGKLFSGTKKLWEEFHDNPNEMKDVFAKECHAALKPEGDYIEYAHIKLSSSKLKSKKISFIFGVPKFQWLVGAGFYIDDVENEIDRMNTDLINQIRTKIVFFVLSAVIVMGLFLLLFNLLNQRLKNDIILFVSFFKRAAFSDEEIDRNNIKFIELDQIAEYANKMQADRIQAMEDLKESEKKHRLFVTSYQGIAYQVDIDGFMPILLGGTVEQIVGYTAEDFLNGSINWLDLIHPDDIQSFKSEIGKLRSEPDFKSESEYRILSKDGQERWVRCTGIVVRINDRDFLQGSVFDITEKKGIEAQLRQAHKMESIGTLAGGIAHEFNNMLGIILGNTELALDDIPDWTPAKRYIKEIRTASLRAKDVVRKLLSVARKAPASREPVRIRKIIVESLDLMRKTIPATIDLKQNIDCSTEMISGDSTEINQIVINLCTNSVHAMTGETGALEVSLDVVQLDRQSASGYEDLKPGDYVRLRVKDTGEGIRPANMDRIFDPYFTTKDVDKGLGMGLAVVHGIVKKHDGAIKIKSEIGKGTTVEVLFPLIEEQPAPGGEKAETLPTGTERILFVDDEASLVSMARRVLSRSGYQVVGKTSSADALGVFADNPEGFDLVITDMTMPEMRGDQLARQIIRIRPDIPIILCTGHSEYMDEDKARELGIKAFAMKPLAKSDLTETVRKVLDAAGDKTRR